MRAPVFGTLVVILLAGCQSPEVPQPPQNVQPLNGEVTFGKAPVVGALQTDEQRFSYRRGGSKSSVVVTRRSIIDASREGDIVRMRISVLDVNIARQNARGVDISEMERDYKVLEGATFELEVDASTGDGTATMKRGVEVTSYGRGEGVDWTRLITQSHLGGQTVRQWGEVAGLPLSDMLRSGETTNPEAYVSGRVIGQTFHAGRPVVVVSVAGTMLHAGKPLDLSGAYYVDMSTGVSIHASMTLSGVEIDGVPIGMTATQDMKLN